METHRIEIRISEDHAATIAAAAAKRGLPVATWVRMIALAASTEEVVTLPTKI